MAIASMGHSNYSDPINERTIMKATVNFEMPKVISQAIAEQGFKRYGLEQSLALLEALFHICEYETLLYLERNGETCFPIKYEADLRVASELAKAADYFYLDVDRGSYKNYQILLTELMNANPRLHVAIVEFNLKLDLGEIDSFDYSEIALATFDKLQ